MLFRSDRKSTRLNSSHTIISYAVFCLKKKNDSLAAAAHPTVDKAQPTHTHTRAPTHPRAVSRRLGRIGAIAGRAQAPGLLFFLRKRRPPSPPLFPTPRPFH